MLKEFFLQFNSRNVAIYKHSLTVAKAARIIAGKCPNLIPDSAYLYGEMHDFGKFFLPKPRSYKHPRIGYELLKKKYLDIANICAYHSFAIANNDYISAFCKHDKEEVRKVNAILSTIKINDYIELIQLCDKLSGIDNYVSIQQKMEWYSTQFIINNDYVDKLYQIKNKFDLITGVNIYKLLNIQN